MSEREYVVVVNRGEDLEAFDAELEASTGSGPIPNRSVEVANPRPGSDRMTQITQNGLVLKMNSLILYKAVLLHLILLITT